MVIKTSKYSKKFIAECREDLRFFLKKENIEFCIRFEKWIRKDIGHREGVHTDQTGNRILSVNTDTLITYMEKEEGYTFKKGYCRECGKKLSTNRWGYCKEHTDFFWCRRLIWNHFSLFISYRDDYKCVLCGENENTEIHHKVPISEGGLEFDPENCVSLCYRCHKRVHLKKGIDPIFDPKQLLLTEI